MRYFLAFLFALLAGPVSAADNMFPTPGNALAQGVVNMCWNGTNAVPCSVTTPLQIAGSFSASLGGFTPSASGARGTPVSVTTSDSSGTLPTGAVVAVTNVGANPMYCNVNGIAATTSDQYISSSGGWFAFTIPAAITTLHCIATGSSTTANMVGGSGLPTGTGGGGGSGGGAVTNAGTFAVQVTADSTAAALLSAVQAPIVAGTNNIGNVGPLAYPIGATPITASATGTTAATTATLAGAVAKTTYICSLSVRANATANTNVTDTVTGVITGTLSRALWVPANTAGLGVDEQIYSPCIPASATNTAIAVVSGAPGTGGVVTVNATGYQQ